MKKVTASVLPLLICLAFLATTLWAQAAFAADWTRIASGGLTPPDPTNLNATPGAFFDNGLMVGSDSGPNPGPMHRYDGTAFKKIFTSGFGGANSAILPYAAYRGELYIGTTNTASGCELWKWDGSGDPVLVRGGGFGEGAASDTALPLGVIDGRLVVGVTNFGANPGVRVFTYDGSAWEMPVGPGAPVAPGFGDPQNNGLTSNQPVEFNSKLIFPVTNSTSGLKVYSYDGNSFDLIGQPGAGLWPPSQFFAYATVSHAEGKVYLGTGTSLAAPGQLWSYDGSAWEGLVTDGFGSPDNRLIKPLSRGTSLFAITRNAGGCRVYQRSGSGFNAISEPGLGEAGNNDGFLSSFNGNLLAFTANPAGSNVYATPTGPTIDRLIPNSGPYGTSLTIEGNDFGAVQGNGFVDFSGVQVSKVYSWSDTSITLPVPPEATSGPVRVTNDFGTSNALAFTVTLSDTYYFAEGTTRDNAEDGSFEEWISLQNPGDEDASASLTYMLGDGSTEEQAVPLPKRSRVTVNVNERLGPDRDVSTLVESDRHILAERPMYFNYRNKWTGGDNVMGLTAPRESFYFAEGTTRNNIWDGSYEEWLCIQNPGGEDARVNVIYMLETGENIERTYVVGATSRRTVDVNLEVGPDHDVSMVVDSDRPVVAERPMYFNYRNKWIGGHNVIGAAGPDTLFYFAEGTTRDNLSDGSFEEWICIQNPQEADAVVDLTYYTAQAGVQTQRVTVPAGSRQTVDVKLRLGADVDTSFMIESSVPVLVERPMYFNYHNMWAGGHNVMGCASPKRTFYFAEGTTLEGFDTWVAVMNTGNKAARVTFRYLLGDGSKVEKTDTVEPRARYTREVLPDVGPNRDVSVVVEADQNIVAERPMYFGYHGWCPGGSDTLGYGI